MSHALRQHGESKPFWELCDDVEERLIDADPEDKTTIIEMVAT